jgi:hypothetical protein
MIYAGLARQGGIDGSLDIGACISPPIVKRWVGVWQVRPPHLIAMICIFHGANRSLKGARRKRALRVGKQLTFLTFNTTSRSMSSNTLYLSK